jgi:hypothetical protein
MAENQSDWMKAKAPLLLQNGNTKLPSAESFTSPLDPFYSQATRTLLGQYRKDDAADPEVFAASCTALFSDYPKDVVAYATDPRTGLVTVHAWLPNIAEVRKFCEDLMQPRRQAAYDRASAERRRNTPALAPPRETRLTLEELKAKHGPNWGLQTAADKHKAAAPILTDEQIRERAEELFAGFPRKKKPAPDMVPDAGDADGTFGPG